MLLAPARTWGTWHDCIPCTESQCHCGRTSRTVSCRVRPPTSIGASRHGVLQNYQALLIYKCDPRDVISRVPDACRTAAMAASFSYEQLDIDNVRWYWNKQPLNLKGKSAVYAIARAWTRYSITTSVYRSHSSGRCTVSSTTCAFLRRGLSSSGDRLQVCKFASVQLCLCTTAHP